MDNEGVVRCYSADIRIKCADCGLDFSFLGLETGLDRKVPCVEFGGKEARMPITPCDKMMIGDFPGYRIKFDKGGLS